MNARVALDGRTVAAAVLVLVTLAASAVAAPLPALGDVQATVAGLVVADRVIAAAVPLASGSWGTDYVTVSHALRVGQGYLLTTDGKTFVDTERIAACSSQYHGIDLLIVRARSHAGRPVLIWGDPTTLRRGDELFILPRPEIHPSPVRITFIHLNFQEWRQASAASIERAWQNVMIADGPSLPGFSGSPWVKDGKVYGLLKGRVRPAGQQVWYTAAESALQIQACLRRLHYPDLIPRE